MRGSPLGIRGRLRNRRINRKRAPGEHPFALIKRVFHAGHVLVTTLPRVHVKMVFACFCFNLVQLGTSAGGHKGLASSLLRVKPLGYRDLWFMDTMKHYSASILISWAPSHKTFLPISPRRSVPSTIVAKWLPCSWPTRLLKHAAP